MADIVAIYDAEPASLPEGQRAFPVGNYFVVTTAGEPSPVETAVFRIANAPVDDARIAGMAADTGVQTLLTQAKTATVAQIDTWLTNNVTTLAQARAVLAAIIKVLAIQAG